MKIMKHRICSQSIAAVGLSAFLFATLIAHAATETWTGATDAAWSSLNWFGSNNVPISGDSLVFDAPGVGGVNLNNNLTNGTFNISGITFNSGAGAFVIGDGVSTGTNAGNPFVLTGNVTNNSTSLQTINDSFSMTAIRTFTMTAGGEGI